MHDAKYIGRQGRQLDCSAMKTVTIVTFKIKFPLDDDRGAAK